MKSIFLIGDSIRLGYRKSLAEALYDEAHVYSSDDNARFTAYTMRYLHEWAAHCPNRETVDVVHWNNGLWDACHWDNDPLSLAPLDEYVSHLVRLHRMIGQQFPKAKIIFALSTPVGAQHPRISNDELRQMNQAASEALTPLGVVINPDLNRLVDAHPEYILPDQTHMTSEGFTALGQAAAAFIRKNW